MEEKLKFMIEQMKDVFGDNLKSVILFGSKASGEDTKKHSNYNTLIIFSEVNFELIKKIMPITLSWIKAGNPPPFVFSLQMFKDSADVFPIEFFDMKDHHKVFYGDDPFVDIEIIRTNLRHQCEFELKGKLLNLRQRYLASMGKSDKIQELLIESISPLLVIFRHVIRLYGQEPPQKKIEALESLSKHIGFNPEIFITIMRLKNGERYSEKDGTEKLASEYFTQIEKVVNYVNAID